jgi:restriction system protein
MSRRKGGLTESLEVASRLPWKVSLALAPATFVVFHLIAAATVQKAPVTHLGNMSSAAIRGYIHISAVVLQFIVPVLFLAAACVALAKRWRSRALLDGVRRGTIASLATLSWQDFQRLVSEGFMRRGYLVAERGGAEPDGGIDLLITRGSERFLVQFKQWKAQSVSVSVVRELYAAMSAEGTAGGFAVTSGTFSMDAKKFASGRNIELIDGQGLRALFSDAAVMPAGPRP